MTNLKNNSGFTLIELMVVIAIIIIFSGVALAALGASKTKGQDASIKSTLANMRAQGELYYNTNKTYGGDVAVMYTGKCSTVTTTNVFGASGQGSIKDLGVEVNRAVGSTGTTSCAIDFDSWAFGAKLTDGTAWCVDSSGVSRQAGVAAAGAVCN